MPDNYPVPPPPPPQARMPVPPPPPRQFAGGEPSGQPLHPQSVGAPRLGTPPSNAPAAPGSRPPAQAGLPKPADTSMAQPRPASGMPPMPGMPGSAPSAIEQRLQDMEKRFHEQESAKSSLESQLSEIGSQLKEEHEKVILQSLKAKEEEALSSRVEQQIREMQEKLRRDKHEQELHESRAKAENQLKDLERRLTEERESWMAALKNQLKERELIEQDVEHNLSRKLRETEARFQDEKTEWMTTLRQKEEELNLLRRQMQQETESTQNALEERDEAMETARDGAAEARRSLEREMQAEMKTLQSQLDSQMREAGASKAQIALFQAQIQQLEAQRLEERLRGQSQIQRLEQEHLEIKKRLEAQSLQREENAKQQFDEERQRTQTQIQHLEQEHLEVKKRLEAQFLQREEDTKRQFDEERQRTQSQIQRLETQLIQREEDVKRQFDDERRRLENQAAAREEDSKREYLHRDQDRTQYWEGVMAQTRSEKEALKASLLSREEEITRLQIDDVERRRVLDIERAHWQDETKKISQAAHDEALRNLPAAFEERLGVEHKKWDAQYQAVVLQLKNQLTKASESQKAVMAKLDVETQRAEQTIQVLREQINALVEERNTAQKSLQDEKDQRESQTKSFMQRMAEVQQHESAIREEMESQNGHLQKLGQEWQDKLDNQAQVQANRSEAQEKEWQDKLDSQAQVHTNRSETQEQEWQARLEQQAQEWNTQLAAKERVTASQAGERERMAAELEKISAEKNELVLYRVQTEEEVSALRLEINSMAQAQLEWKSTLVQDQADRSQREQEWADKEKAWMTTKADWENTIAELQKAKAAAALQPLTPAANPGIMPMGSESAKALAAIRQQMQEMQTLITWLRPVKKHPFSKAA